jgi:hypothetical protein
MEATDIQMQTFANERVRPFAEHFRAVLIEARDHKSSIDDVYDRADGGALWNDSRTDGPPHLLKAGTGASPDDVLNFNTFITALTDIIDGVGTDATNAASLRSSWAVLVDACVRPV